MTLEFYKFLHLMGLILVTSGFTVISVGYYFKNQIEKPWKTVGTIGHGVGLTLLIVSGFGMAAKIGLLSSNAGFLPIWIWAKLFMWMTVGGIVVLVRKKGHQNTKIYWFVMSTLLIPIFLGLFKPF